MDTSPGLYLQLLDFAHWQSMPLLWRLWALVATSRWLTLWGNFRVGFLFGIFSPLVSSSGLPVCAFVLELPSLPV